MIGQLLGRLLPGIGGSAAGGYIGRFLFVIGGTVAGDYIGDLLGQGLAVAIAGGLLVWMAELALPRVFRTGHQAARAANRWRNAFFAEQEPGQRFGAAVFLLLGVPVGLAFAATFQTVLDFALDEPTEGGLVALFLWFGWAFIAFSTLALVAAIASQGQRAALVVSGLVLLAGCAAVVLRPSLENLIELEGWGTGGWHGDRISAEVRAFAAQIVFLLLIWSVIAVSAAILRGMLKPMFYLAVLVGVAGFLLAKDDRYVHRPASDRMLAPYADHVLSPQRVATWTDQHWPHPCDRGFVASHYGKLRLGRGKGVVAADEFDVVCGQRQHFGFVEILYAESAATVEKVERYLVETSDDNEWALRANQTIITTSLGYSQGIRYGPRRLSKEFFAALQKECRCGQLVRIGDLRR